MDRQSYDIIEGGKVNFPTLGNLLFDTKSTRISLQPIFDKYHIDLYKLKTYNKYRVPLQEKSDKKNFNYILETDKQVSNVVSYLDGDKTKYRLDTAYQNVNDNKSGNSIEVVDNKYHLKNYRNSNPSYESIGTSIDIDVAISLWLILDPIEAQELIEIKILNELGKFLPDGKKIDNRIDVNHSNVPDGYFTILEIIDREILYFLIRGKACLPDNFYLDISVGKFIKKELESKGIYDYYFRKHWITNCQHTYPDRQGYAGGPQMIHCYKLSIYDEIRAIVKDYINKKFLPYLKRKGLHEEIKDIQNIFPSALLIEPKKILFKNKKKYGKSIF